MSTPPEAGPTPARPRHAGPPGRPPPAASPPDAEPLDVGPPDAEPDSELDLDSVTDPPSEPPTDAPADPPADAPSDPPTEPIRTASWWPPPTAAPSAAPTDSPAVPEPTVPEPTVPGWLVATVLAILVGLVGVLGFVKPGFFVTPVLDQASVQNGVRAILRDEYRLPNVAAVTCPAGQKVRPTGSFSCSATIDGRRVEVPVVIQDKEGRYQVGQPL